MVIISDLNIQNNSEIDAINEIFKKTWKDTIKEQLKKHIEYEGFLCKVIRDNGRIIGFAYSYSSMPEQYYHNLLKNHLDKDIYRDHFIDCFEFVELALLPEYRGSGFGSLLVQKMIEGINHSNITLTTQYNNSVARNLYSHFCFDTINDDFTPSDEKYVIMSKTLK